MVGPKRALSRAPRLKRQVTICEDSLSIPDTPRIRNTRSSSPKSPRQPGLKQSHASLVSTGGAVVTILGQSSPKPFSPLQQKLHSSSPQIFRYEEEYLKAATLQPPPSPGSPHSSVAPQKYNLKKASPNPPIRQESSFTQDEIYR